MIATEIKKISYWNEYVRWYKLWREHNSYHEPIKNFIFKFIQPKIKILDIGAGDGVLAFPLIKIGNYVTALEPSQTMQEYLYENSFNHGVKLKIEPRRFEDLESSELREFDLALACNSLHLTDYGIEGSIVKLFSSQINSIFLVTEKTFSIDKISSNYPEYSLIFNHSYICESSFAYHSLDEAFEHWQFKYKRELFSWEKENLMKSLCFEKDHFWLKDYAFVNIFYWRRIK
ncbi:MAG: class I SAM-dependent methyltransferase [Thermodesulfovibrio sp.]